jgi:S-methylmethionine-dependent homocysteine/selenocysteine methylase
MSKYRNNLPQLAGGLFLTDSGMETTLVFHDGIDLPCFASFDLMKSAEGVARTRAYYERHIAMAQENGLGFVLESPTWRANPDWGAKIGYSREALADVNRRCLDLMDELRRTHETPRSPIVVSGNIGPRGDGYVVENAMSAREAEDYHGWQVSIFRDTAADMVSAFTINYVEEAIGVARAAKAAGIPSVISFTLETDGNLPTGQTLKDAIAQVDRETGNAPAYYMINCAHPTHFEDALKRGEPWLMRLRGLRANASKRSHAELDSAPDLDIGDPIELGRQYRDLRSRMQHLTVLGGCCGTDHRHVEQICVACLAVAA